MTASQGSFYLQDENANKLPNLQEPSCMGDWQILRGQEQASQGPPRTSQHNAARRSSMAKKIFSGP
jgi:hypothetical protein